MTKKKSNKSVKNNLQSNKSIAIVFLVAGAALLISESTRVTGVPFLILGLVFLATSQEDSKKKSNKTKK